MFPGMHSAVETFSTLHSDVLVLLGYDLDKQTKVVKNVKAFIARIAHRALADMVRMHRTEEFASIWYSADVSDKQKERCEKVCYLVLISSLIHIEALHYARHSIIT